MAGEATYSELREFEQLILQNKQWAILANQLSTSKVKPKDIDETEAEASFGVHAMKMRLIADSADSLPDKKFSKGLLVTMNAFKIAGVAAILLLIFGYLYIKEEFNRSLATPTLNEVVSKKGSRSSVKLPDGSFVSLNADSKLSYASDFAGATREVFLVGEAFFDVVKDPARPFIIHTDKIDVRVLGTAFNVKAYPQDDVIETSLIRGRVEVTSKDRPLEKVILNPNEKLVFRKDQTASTSFNSSVPKIQLNNITTVKDSLLAETAWLSDKIVFTNEPLNNIAKMLERHFNVEIEIKDVDVQGYAYTGIFEREPLSKILELMSISQKFNYEINGNKITISK
jgi:ferric-dicitrate binding protein FerR (iron transport regulator)